MVYNLLFPIEHNTCESSTLYWPVVVGWWRDGLKKRPDFWKSRCCVLASYDRHKTRKHARQRFQVLPGRREKKSRRPWWRRRTLGRRRKLLVLLQSSLLAWLTGWHSSFLCGPASAGMRNAVAPRRPLYVCVCVLPYTWPSELTCLSDQFNWKSQVFFFLLHVPRYHLDSPSLRANGPTRYQTVFFLLLLPPLSRKVASFFPRGFSILFFVPLAGRSIDSFYHGARARSFWPYKRRVSVRPVWFIRPSPPLRATL